MRHLTATAWVTCVSRGEQRRSGKLNTLLLLQRREPAPCRGRSLVVECYGALVCVDSYVTLRSKTVEEFGMFKYFYGIC